MTVAPALRWFVSDVAGVVAARRPGFSARVPYIKPSIIAGSAPLGSTNYAVPGGAIFVNPSAGNDSTGTGLIGAPYATVAKAISVATTGATIVARGGTYHESLSTPSNKALALQAYPGEVVWFDGSSVQSVWTNNGNGTWTAAYSPTYDRTLGGSVSGYPGAASRILVDQLWIDNVAMTQLADNTTAPAANQFSVNQSAHTVTIGSNPAGHAIRYTNLSTFLVGSGRLDLKGIGIRRYSPQMVEFLSAMIYLGGTTSGMIIENVIFSESAMGGWSVATTNVTIRNVTVQDCGYSGGLFTTADGLLVQKCLMRRLNRGGWTFQPATAGMKGTRTDNFVLRDNIVTDVPSAAGIWLDVSCTRFSIANNYVDGSGINSMTVGITTEESDGGFYSGVQYLSYVVGNTVLQCTTGLLMLCTGNTVIANNDLRRNDLNVYSQQDRAQNGSTFGQPNKDHSECPWHTVNNSYINNIFDVLGGPANFQIQFLAYDDGPKVDRGWDQIALLAGNRFHTAGAMAQLGTLGGARTAYSNLAALAASGSDVGGPPGAKLGTNYQGTDMGNPASYAYPLPAQVAALIGSTTGLKIVGPVAELVPTTSESGASPAPTLPWLNTPTLLPWAPPALATGYRTVHVDDTAANRHISLSAGQDCLIIMPNTPVTDISAVGTYEALITVSGGRNVVLIGGHITCPQPAPTTLTAAIGTDDTTLPVASTASFPASGMGRVQGESFRYTSKDATHLLGVTRHSGFFNDSAASSNTTHPSGATVYVAERQRSAIGFTGQTGIVHVEGLLIDGFVCDGLRFSGHTGTARVQRCRIQDVTNYDLVNETDGHPDAIQAYGGGFAEIDCAQVSIILAANGNGIINKGSDGTDSTQAVPQWRLRNVEVVSTGSARSLIANSDGASSAFDITDSWLRFPPSQPVVFSSGATIRSAFSEYAYAAGQDDIVPANRVGSGYVSPGYAA